MRCFKYFCLIGIVVLFFGVIMVFAGGDVKVNQDTDSSIQNEPSITINHHYTGDLLNIVVAYNDIGKTLGVSYSPDSGYTWTDVQLPYVWMTTGDPSVASDINGNVYACFLSFEGNWFYGKSGIFVCKSTDGGRNWLNPVAADSLVYSGGSAVPFADKCFMTVDTNSASSFVGNIYVGWQRDDTLGQNSDIYFARSTDGGLSFSTPIKINDNPPQTAYAEGAFPFVGADGDVYISWYDCYFKGGVPGSLYVDKSVDGGQTFGTDIKVVNFLAPPLYTTACNNFKAKSFPSAAGDPSGPEKLYITYISDPDGYPEIRVDGGDDPGGSPSDRPEIIRNGNYVYIAWEDYRNGGSSDIYFNRSTDNGQNWELKAMGPLDNTDIPGLNNSQMLELSSSGNFVYCVWHDYRSLAGFVDIYFTSSLDYGKTWKADQHMDGSAMATSMYPSIASTGTYVYLAWQDNRSGNNDIYFIRSTDNGAVWGAPTRIDLGDVAGANMSQYPRLACQGSYVYCMWLDMRSGVSYHPYFNYSTDNGVTWQANSVKLSQGIGSWCQLPLRGGLECTGNYVYACWGEDRSMPGISEIFYNRSTNNGASWGLDVRVSDSTGNTCFNPSMDIQGNYVYIGWEDYRISGFSEVFFDYSTDNGVTWQSPDIGPLDAGGIGLPSMLPQIKSEGSYVYVTWYDTRLQGPPLGDVFFARSTNNGTSWQAEVHINTGAQPFALQNTYPVMAAGNGWVNIAWADPRCVYYGMGHPDIFTNYSSNNGATWLSGPDEADVFCVRSTNGGTSWQTPVRVNDDATTYPDVLPWVAVKSNGLVDIAYYHFDITHYDLWVPGAQARMAVSSDGGLSFRPSFAIQDTIIPPLTRWVGEYIGIAPLDSLVYTVFIDLEQSGNSDIYIDRSVNPITTSVWGDDYEDQENIRDIDVITLYQNYPNPFNPQTNIEFLLEESGQVKIEIFNILGQKVRTLIDQYLEKGYKTVRWDGKDNQGQKLSSGVYWYEIQARDFTQTKKMLLLK